MSLEKELLKRGHTNPLSGAKKVKSMIEMFESRIANDIDNFIDPDFDKETEKKED